MKRKLVTLLLALCSLFALGSLAACGDDAENAHVHSFATQNDETDHWTTCDCGETTPRVKHTYEKGAEGSCIDWICSCGHIKPTEGLQYTLSADGDFYIVKSIGSAEGNNIVIPAFYNGLPVQEIGADAFYRDTSTLPAIGLPDSLTSITLPEGITAIGEKAFGNRNNLRKVNIPDSVTSIGYQAFVGCATLIENEGDVFYVDKWMVDCNRSMSTATLKADTVGIIDGAFDYCYHLTNISLEKAGQLAFIGKSAISNCPNLTEIIMPNSSPSIGEGAFKNCTRLSTVWVTDVKAWCSTRFADEYSNPLLHAHSLYDYNLYANPNLTIDKKMMKEITVPSGISSIGNYAFVGGSTFKKITIPNSVTSIGGGAFAGCSSLEELSIPNSVTSIGANAFAECSNLTQLTIPNSVTSIGANAFAECSNLTQLTIPDSVTSIGANAFTECSALTEITIPDSITSIEELIFSNCSSLKKVTIPSSVDFIGESAFLGCLNLNAVYISDISNWCSITFCNGDSNPLKYAKNLYVNNRLLTELTIPNAVTSIAARAFYGYNGLTEITIPDSVTAIGAEAFAFCDNLVDLTISDGVTSIEAFAFNSCPCLTKVILPDSVSFIGRSAFKNCTSLTEILLSKSITSINSSTFLNCNSLTNVIIPDKVTSIEHNAFENCTSLKKLTIPNHLASIGSSAFENCNNLNAVYIQDIAAWCSIVFFDESSNPLKYANNLYVNYELITQLEIPEKAARITKYAFFGCSSLTNVIIPDNVVFIGAQAFANCNNLTSITLPFIGATKDDTTNTSLGHIFGASSSDWNKAVPASLKNVVVTGGTFIGDFAFKNCTSLTNITMPISITSIKREAFLGCGSLTSIVIPDSVTSIGENAFSSCSKLTSVTFENTGGWKAGNTEISSTDLTNTTKAAEYLKNTYSNYIWRRSDE